MLACASTASGTRLLALGRYSTAKGLDVVVAAVPLAGPDVELHVHGPALNDEERAHRAELEQLVGELGLGGRVTIGDAVPRSEIPALLAAHDALVNNMRAGAPDKVVYEAAAACRPVLASNPIFDELLDSEQRFPRWDPSALADRIRTLAELSPDARAALGGRLRERVAAGHSVQSWARGDPRRSADVMTDGVVLHTQKVAGISGSEAHLSAAAPGPAGAGLGRPLPDAPRGRARGVGVRATRSARAASRSTTSGCERTSTRSHSARSRRTSAASGPGSSTPISSTQTFTGSSRAP